MSKNVYHILVYTDELHVYTHPYAVHIFTNVVEKPDNIIQIAKDILDKHFGTWWNEAKIRYIGIERLPIKYNIPNYYYIATKIEYRSSHEEPKVLEHYGDVPKELVDKIMEIRETNLTLDYDYDWKFKYVHDVLDDYPNGELFKTFRGYHVRVKLNSKLNLEEILKIREEYRDDENRIALDKAYMQCGLSFLTNLLFNEKYWFDDGLKHYSEQKVSRKDLFVNHHGRLSYPLPKVRIEVYGGYIEVDGYDVNAYLPVSNRHFNRMVKSIEDNFWEYQVIHNRNEDIKARIFKAYFDIKPYLAEVISKCEIKYNYSHVVIHVPEELSKYIGVLIGKNGANIKYVENKVGVKIKITQEKVPEDVELKRKLQNMLKSLVNT